MRIQIVSLIAPLVLAAVPAAATYYSTPQLSKVTAVQVEVRTEIHNGCLHNSFWPKREAEIILRRAGIKLAKISDPKKYFLSIKITGHALPDTGLCIASVVQSLIRPEELQDGTLGMVQAFKHSAVLSGSKENLHTYLHEWVSAYITELTVEILKAWEWKVEVEEGRRSRERVNKPRREKDL